MKLEVIGSCLPKSKSAQSIQAQKYSGHKCTSQHIIAFTVPEDHPLFGQSRMYSREFKEETNLKRTVFLCKSSLFCHILYKAAIYLMSKTEPEGKHSLEQCFSTAGPRPGTGTWHQLHRAARGSPGSCHFSFLSIFHE